MFRHQWKLANMYRKLCCFTLFLLSHKCSHILEHTQTQEDTGSICTWTHINTHAPWYYVFPFGHAGNRKRKRCFLWKNGWRGWWPLWVYHNCVWVYSILWIYVRVYTAVSFVLLLSEGLLVHLNRSVDTTGFKQSVKLPRGPSCWHHSLHMDPNTSDLRQCEWEHSHSPCASLLSH